ncbi:MULTISPECIES: ATP-binding cassette domain-containing protein [Providencia]|uniref:ATP-binding cassette domain-containing protein n=1 Tax=Providencia huaxiensis TaxID=2027290 RepID=A0ABU2IT03_9GAMM|nr:MULTISPECIES: ATP-binding cassette domain-containing protein [Providencia]MBZ3682344.1 ATP-binding cassette domain-containing protein [Providencia rettgeri]AXH63010.1 ATP-binding cassette domain-containing protein [Providencia huaxiensis]MDT0132195.1 ATP-binding cassette domain-containing protein [Providencia huaxiensis]MDT1978601.1 ATP-binding cassette domain-containing protein [Providencia huaxiensis]QLR01726.1 ATP-binding cassette domain-containing protein [Providencia rettgeri]
MKESSFHDVINQYFKILGESFISPALSYDNKYILNNINEFINNDFFTYQYVSISDFSEKNLPALFIMEIENGKYIIIKNHKGQLTNLTTDTTITQQLIESKNLFSFSASENTLNEESIYTSLIKLTPKSSLFSLPLIVFALLLPLYSNLFNSRLVYSESISSILYISFIFIVVIGLEFFIKHIIHEQNIKKTKLNISIFNRYFVNLLKQSSCKSASIKVRTAEASILQVWEIKPQIIYDIGLAILFSFCIFGMLGFYSLLLLSYYAGLIFLCLHVRFLSYKNMLRANTLNYEKSAMYYSLEQKKHELYFARDNHFKQYISTKTNEDEKIKLKLNEANHHWMEIIKVNTFLSMIIMYVASYLAIGEGSLSLASVIAVMIINGRLSGAITSAINRLFMVKTHLFHIKSSIDQLKNNPLIHFKVDGIATDSIKHFSAKNLSVNINGKTIINQLNIEAKPGDVIGITGISGVGKTSLMKALCGTSEYSSGDITINSIGIDEISQSFLTEKIAYHNGISTFIHGSIRDNFNFYGVFDNNTIVRLTKLCCPTLLISKETLDDTLVTDIAASTGEKQKLQLVLALIKQPEMIFLDESTSFMATSDALSFLQLIKQEFELDKSIIFFSTHDLGLTSFFTKHIALSPGHVKHINAPQPHNEIIIPKISLS